MNPTIKNILAVVAGLLGGGIVNMGLIFLGAFLIPPPAGVDVMDVDSLAANLHLFETKHFLFPFLAHAAGALLGAFIATKIASPSSAVLGIIVGAFFMIGGIINAFGIPAPTWFIISDLVLAYLPAGYLGSKLAIRS